MNWIMLISVVCGISMQQISQKIYSTRNGGGNFVFSAVSALCAMLFFLAASGGELSFKAEILTYSLAFAVAYAASIIGLFLAIKSGPLSLTSLFTSYSLIIPTAYGIVILNEPIDMFVVLGIVLLLISLSLVNGNSQDKEKRVSVKWILFVLLSFVGNGLCTVIQKIQQQNFAGEYKSEFMIVALGAVAIMLGILTLVSDKKVWKSSLKSAGVWCALCGLCNGLVNLLVMLLTNRMNVSIMFPLISAGGIVVTFIVSQCVYKENLSLKQKAGVLLGILAVIALNL